MSMMDESVPPPVPGRSMAPDARELFGIRRQDRGGVRGDGAEHVGVAQRELHGAEAARADAHHDKAKNRQHGGGARRAASGHRRAAA